jgi:cysteine sulfinate desulfinase/cysteine desulfurase-like protein
MVTTKLVLYSLLKKLLLLPTNTVRFFMTDATQAVGKIPVDVIADGIDLLALSAHKMYGPKGVGALYVRRKGPRVKVTAQMDGGGHERGMRSGTLTYRVLLVWVKPAKLPAWKWKAKQYVYRPCAIN